MQGGGAGGQGQREETEAHDMLAFPRDFSVCSPYGSISLVLAGHVFRLPSTTLDAGTGA